MNLAHIKILAWEHWRRCLKTVVPVTILASLLLITLQFTTKMSSPESYSHPDEFYSFIIQLVGFINILILLTIA